MDDPGLQWPAWKFGMRREDLFTKLHDQYNTISSSIQDPEAFHHDVFEISNTASTSDEFHTLLLERKQQRLRELNETLESASLEIIANPTLIGTQQWQHAVQLFRTKSLDSLVRYFSSYLPEDHPWHDPLAQGKPTSDAVPVSTVNVTGSHPGPIKTSFANSHFPPSPISLATYSDESSAVSPIDDIGQRHYDLNTLTPARTLSFSESDTDIIALSGTLSVEYDEDMSQSDEPDSPITSMSDMSELHSLPDHTSVEEAFDEYTGLPALDHVNEVVDGCNVPSDGTADDQETPTPRPASSDIRFISQNTQPSTCSIHNSAPALSTHAVQECVRSSLKSRRETSPGLTRGRKSPDHTRITKPDPIRVRSKGRRRA
jgi:hypothetical protein